VLQAKHMGSRAIVLLSRSEEAATARFGAPDTAVLLSRTGRRLSTPDSGPSGFSRSSGFSGFSGPGGAGCWIGAVARDAVGAAGLWDELGTDWLVLDAELLPWSAAGAALLDGQYRPVGAAAVADTEAVEAVLAATEARLSGVTGSAGSSGLDGSSGADGSGGGLAGWRELAGWRVADARAFDAAWRRYAGTGEPERLAPFCLLAGEGEVYARRPVDWQLGMADRLVAAAPERLVRTARCTVRLADPDSRAAGERWWRALVDAGGEGAVVKPAQGLLRGPGGLAQPGLKVRGPDYLRLVYGPHYLEPANLDRLRRRDLSRKRALALREYALGLESLHRFVQRQPLWRVHEAVAAVLALESEPVDARL
jgi:protein phosphatase